MVCVLSALRSTVRSVLLSLELDARPGDAQALVLAVNGDSELFARAGRRERLDIGQHLSRGI